MRTILNIDIAMLDGTPAPAAMRQPPVRLFQMGEASASTASGWSRWGTAVAIAGLVHAGLFAGMLAVRPAARPAAQADAPELVLFAYAPPPPPAAAAGAAPAVAAPRPVQARNSRPVIAKRAPVPQAVRAPEPVPEPRVETPPTPAVEAPPAVAQVAAASTGVQGGAAVGGIAGGAVGGVTGGQLGGIAGAPLSLKQVKQRPQPLSQVTPHYPRSARSQGITGTVLVSIIIGTDGRVEAQHTKVLRSIPALDEAAVEAVNQWRFSPGLGSEGRPVRVLATLPIDFSLR
jgi:periplasmic protein TonB